MGKSASKMMLLLLVISSFTFTFNICSAKADIIELPEGKLEINVYCTMPVDSYEYWINVSLKNIGDQSIYGELQYILKTEEGEVLFIEEDKPYLAFSLSPGEEASKSSHTGGYWEIGHNCTMTVRVVVGSDFRDVTVKPSIITPVMVPTFIELPPELEGKLEIRASCIMPTPYRYRINVTVENIGDRPITCSLQYILKTEKGEILYIEKDEPWLEIFSLSPGEEAGKSSHTGGYWTPPPDSDWNKWTMTVKVEPIIKQLFDSDFQYNLDDNYGTVEGTGHLSGVATLSAGTLSIEGQITINGPLPSTIPEVYLIATDGSDKEFAKQVIDLSGFSYTQIDPNTYSFSGQIPNVIQPINNGHYEAEAKITYDTAKYEFFVNAPSLINSHYLPLTILLAPPTTPKFLTLPLKDVNVRIQQGWNYTWDAPGISTHKGIDYIKGEVDKPETWQSFEVVAAADGLAIWSEGGGYGKFVLIQHNEKDQQGKHYYTLYAHLESVDIGDQFYHSYEERGRWNDDQWNNLISCQVRRGDVIGRAGATGVPQPTWIHLHFEVQRGGYALGKTDPYDLYNIRDYYPGGSRYVRSGKNHLWTTDPPSFPFNCPPICNVKLQKDGIEINEINVGEFFDIYVGGSMDDIGIKQVRFSSDDVQDGTPTGRWTEWCEWDASSGGWNAYSKIERWTFTTPGYKEVWAEVKDDAGQTAQGHVTIFVPYPALPVITSPLVITPAKDFYVVGDSVAGEFTIKNIGDAPIALDVLAIGGRLNGWSVVDFTHVSVTLQPGESYIYKGYLTFNQRGSYHFFIAYHIQNPTAEEKKLLDENNWNTCVQLGEGLTHTDRVKNLIVFDEGTVPEEVTMLKEKIEELKRQQINYPPYLRDPNSFSSAVAVVWADITSFATRTYLTEMYDELYFTGIRYDCLRFNALINAEYLLEAGDIEGAKRYLQKSYLYDRLSAMSFSAAAEVFENNLEVAETLAKGVKEGCEAAVSLGVKIVYSPAAPIVDGICTDMDFIITTKLEGIEQATKDLIIHMLTQELLKNVEFVSLEDNVLIDYVNEVAEKVSLDTLLANKEFMEEFGHALRDTIIVKVVNELGISLTETEIEEVVEGAVNYLESLINSIKAKVKSPVELRIINSKGQISGLINKRVKHEIPMSLYHNGTVTIFFPSDTYYFEVTGTDEGTYGLEIFLIRAGSVTEFIATNIPTSSNAVHRYTIDFNTLSQGGGGVTVQVDSNGDGIFEHTFTSDSELNQSEYNAAIRRHVWEAILLTILVASIAIALITYKRLKNTATR
jgi:murein DD-endopeptidase MepM/ murein hydrolase activator NlpD